MNETYQKARRHLSRRDPILKAVIQRAGKCLLTPRPDDPLTMLVKVVISQQISVKAAASIYARLTERVKPMTAAKLRKLTPDDFVACGISRPKQRAIVSLLDHVAVEKAFLKQLPTLEDEAFREAVVRIKGLGPWSADMLLMFGFGRLDVMPVGDLGIKLAIRDLWKLDALPSVQTMLELSEPWRPYRTVASWYLWRSRDWAEEY
ncbi:DNA-3-methyladenine glycosylase family protein [Limnoglobus roseus]|uniref:DNA-3-methyladenine glycosylase II n=1 Tax=Limnoglobus roseus TaxID=2598579 RepID=A0A5C1AC74_9BACT|nr:DNA-3-methyladenine glycosylase [Limnoglobus roseus]QEL15783.1 DNA-3-methyladenine glycosylase 2 family protein [Limnoglobus roseus]